VRTIADDNIVDFPAPKPSLDELIEAAAKLPPGPAAWEPIFRHYPELTAEELAAKFREAAERQQREADELERLLKARE
jgi:hypothetical protein